MVALKVEGLILGIVNIGLKEQVRKAVPYTSSPHIGGSGGA